jgi:phosphatidate cytidylyltransferase
VKQRVLTAVVLLAIVVGALFFDPTRISAAILLVAIAVVGSLELERLIDARRGWVAMPVTAAALFFVIDFFLGHRFSANEWRILSMNFMVIGALTFWWKPRNWISSALILASGVFALAQLALAHVVKIPLLLIAAIPIWCGDTAAIFAGKAFGKHKMAPALSPNKTWEGGIANFLACVIAALAVGRHAGLETLTSVALGINCGVMGQIGDLFESSLKRTAGVKDSGTLLPGHGGVLDRLDSLLATAPISVFLLLWEQFIH